MIIQNCDIITARVAGQNDNITAYRMTNLIVRNCFLHSTNDQDAPHVDCVEYIYGSGMKLYNNIMIGDSVWGSASGGSNPIIWRPDPDGDTDTSFIYNNFVMANGRWASNGNDGTIIFTRWNSGEDTDAPLVIAHNTLVSRGVNYDVIGLEFPRTFSPFIVNNVLAQYGDGINENGQWFGCFRNSTGSTNRS